VRPSACLDDRQLEVVGAIYADAFPDHLRVPFSQLAETGRHDQLYIGLDGDAPVGFAAVRLLDPAGWVFLRYFAIAAGRRRERCGQQLWQLLRESVAREGWPERICFEVEDPAQASGDEAERLVRAGRVAFWQSCGTVVLPVPGYVMPDITGSAEPEPMLLMAPAGGAEFSAGQLTELVLAIYTGRYGLRPDDTLVRLAVESIQAGG
jgi:hypothetical protein